MTRKKKTASQPIYLVLANSENQIDSTLYYASQKARRTKGKLGLLYVISPSDMRLNASVEELFYEEQREKAESILNVLAEEIDKLSSVKCVIYMRTGNLQDELIKLLEEDEMISEIILGTTTGRGEDIGKFLTHCGKKLETVNKPILIVPSNLTFEEVEAILP